MTRLFLLTYVAFIVVGIVVFLYDVYRHNGKWSELILGIILSLIPMVNVIVGLTMLFSIIINSRTLNKRVFK